MPDAFALPFVRFLAILAVAVLALALLERRWHVLTLFRQETADAPDLAIARVTVMAVILWQTRLPLLLAFAHLDPALIVPPRGWSHLARLVPLQPSIIVTAYGVLMVTTALALVGWKGRLMCGITALLALYLHTIPQLFGMVTHEANHLVLFSVLLAVAPSCDALAVDAVRSAAEAADRGVISGPRTGRAYSLALRAMMLIIGLAYFFPGAWKVARAGGRWFTSDNLSWLILSKLQEMPMTPVQHWVLDQRPLIWCMAVGTIAFELGFVFVVLSPRLRPAAALAGIAFHALTALVMGIGFASLQLTYVVFVPWTLYFRRGADRRGLRPVTLLYDADCSRCRRLVGVIVVNDWLDLVRPVPATGRDRIATEFHRAPGANPVATPAWIVVSGEDGAEIRESDAVARSIAARLPLLWPVRGLLARRPVRRAVASACDLLTRPRSRPESPPLRPRDTPRLAGTDISPALRYTAAAILSAMVLAGSAHVVRTWPVACYPAFDVPASPTVNQLTIAAVDRLGRRYDWSVTFDSLMGHRFETDRWRGLTETFLYGSASFDSRRAKALLKAWQAVHATPPLRSAVFFADTYSLLTRSHADVPLRRRIVGTWAAGPDD